MSNSENGKNGKEKEVERLLKIVDSIARIDTKVSMMDDRMEAEIVALKEEIIDCTKRLSCVEIEGSKPFQIQVEEIKKTTQEFCEKLNDFEKRIVAMEDRARIRDAEIKRDKEKRDQRNAKYRAYGSVIGIIGVIIALLTYLGIRF